ncbi:MAG: HAD family hydrolase [Planctomycetota bacterium]|nr:HAD family hydrolase [Planctomycetota bacterium]
MFSEIDAILFDLGGTLVDYPAPDIPRMAVRCIKGTYAYLVRPEREQPTPGAAVPTPQEAAARRVNPAPGTPPAHRIMLALRRMVRSLSGRSLPRMAEACTRPLLAGSRLYDDAMPVVLALEARGYRLGLVSNTPWGTPEYLWESQVERFNLGPHFPVRCFSSVVGFQKPDRRIFEVALGRMGIPAARTLFVGNDPQADVGGAAGVGMRTAYLRRGLTPPKADPPAPHTAVSHRFILLTLEEGRHGVRCYLDYGRRHGAGTGRRLARRH